MKVAVIGSRGLTISNLEEYLPACITEIVSGVRQAWTPPLEPMPSPIT